MPTVVSLCDFTGAWVLPYWQAGYDVVLVDLQYQAGYASPMANFMTLGADVLEAHHFLKHMDIHGILAAPPCTCFCRPGARWWPSMDAKGETAANVAIFRATLELCKLARGWWALENPPGRHKKLMPEIPAPSWQFQPWEYGDPWVKQTYIWGTAKKPPVVHPVDPEPTRRTPNGRSQGRIAFMSSSWKIQRAETPAGFSQAFFEANP